MKVNGVQMHLISFTINNSPPPLNMSGARQEEIEHWAVVYVELVYSLPTQLEGWCSTNIFQWAVFLKF